jgi:hypothetical protein
MRLLTNQLKGAQRGFAVSSLIKGGTTHLRQADYARQRIAKVVRHVRTESFELRHSGLKFSLAFEAVFEGNRLLAVHFHVDP